LGKSAVIFVSHNLPDINRISTEVMLLEKGKELFLGPAAQGITAYQSLNEAAVTVTEKFINVLPPIRDFQIRVPEEVKFNASLPFRITTHSSEAVGEVNLVVNVFNLSGEYAGNVTKPSQTFGINLESGENCWDCRVQHLPLRPGLYRLAFHLIKDRTFLASCSRIHALRVTGGNPGAVGDCVLEIDEWRVMPPKE
jgi:hypothetical protein